MTWDSPEGRTHHAFDGCPGGHMEYAAVLCGCGCGQPTKIAAKTDTGKGWTAGHPRLFLRGHNRRQAPNLDKWVEDASGCWVWSGKMYPNGYGAVFHRGKHLMAHRAVYERYRGTIPEGLVIDHLCRNRACVNPSHLEPVPPVVNSRRGIRTKLTEAKAEAIRSSRETNSAVATRFGVSERLVDQVRRGKRWAA